MARSVSGGGRTVARRAWRSGLGPVTTGPASPGVGSGSLSPAVVDPIVADAAGQAGVPVSDVTVINAEAVTWPDGGAGLSLPGMVYPQVVAEGYEVILQVGQRTFDDRGRGMCKFRLGTTPG